MEVRKASRARTPKSEVESLRRLYNALRHVNRAIIHSHSREELLPEICRAAVEHGGFLMAWVGWHNPETRLFEPVASAGDDKPGHDDSRFLDHVRISSDVGPEDAWPETRSLAAIAFNTGLPEIANRFYGEAVPVAWRDRARHQGIRAAAAFPLRLGNQLCGALTVYAGRAGYFGDEEVMLLEEAAADTSFALDNFAREEERQRARDIVTRFVSIVESTNDAIVTKSTDGTITSWNPAARRMFGYSSDEVVGRNIALLIPPDRRAEEPNILARISAGERIVDFETVRVRCNGEHFPVSVTISPLRNAEGVVVGASKILRDITDRQQARAALQQSRTRFEVVLKNLNEGLVIADSESDVHTWNPAALRMLGFANQEACPRTLEAFEEIFQLFTLEGALLAVEAWPLSRILAGEELSGFEIRVRNVQQGWERIFSYSGARVDYADGKALAFVTINDITDRKRADIALRRNEALLRNAENIANLGSWELDIASNRLTCSDQMFQIYGVDKKTFNGDYHIFWQSANPADLAAMEAATNAALAGAPRLDVEHRVELSGTPTRYLHVLGDAVRDIHGQVIKLVGTAQDITERKLLEEQFRQARQLEADTLKTSLSEKTALLKEVHHRVKNNLAVVAGLLEMQADSLEDESAKKALGESQRRVLSMALIHEYLYSTEHLDRVNFGQYVHQLASELCESYAIAPDLVTLNFYTDEIELPVHRAIPCGLILNELLSNALKYAFPGGRRGNIEVRLRLLPSGEISLSCIDDGVGIPEHFDLLTAKSLGLRISNILSRQLDGELTLDRSGVGTKFELRLPAPSLTGS